MSVWFFAFDWYSQLNIVKHKLVTQKALQSYSNKDDNSKDEY